MNPLIMDIIENNYIDDEEKLEIEHLQEFKDEALDILENLEEQLISMESEELDSEKIRDIFRAFHSIKGIAGFASQSLIETIAHQTESVLTKLQNGIIVYDIVILEILINSVELIKQICKDFTLVRDKKFNEITKIHLLNIKNIQKNSYKKIEILDNYIFENEDYIKIPVKKMDEFCESLEKIKEYNRDIDSSNVENIKKKMHFELEKIENYVAKFKEQELSMLYKKLEKIAKYTLKTVGIEAKMNFEGENILVEKNMINKLFIPFSQVIRNAITHGLLYKEGEKIIKISAYFVGEKLNFFIENNGQEIKIEKIKDEISSKYPHFKDENLLNAIFLPNFTTKNQVDLLSGRGIGLDIVKDEIEKMNGKIFVFSEQGRGTTFKIEIPVKKYAVQEVQNE